MLNVDEIRKDFPCLNQKVYGKPLAYLDNAATSQKPDCVVDEIAEVYKKYCANINRGAYSLAAKATQKYVEARKTVAKFVSASPDEIVFTKSATESINLVASCLSKFHFKEGDEIILTQMEHHSNIVPWFLISKQLGLKLNVVNVTDDYKLDFEQFKKFIKRPNVKLASFVHASHALGTINPVNEMISIAKNLNVPTLVDGSQAIAHMPVNVKELGCDFYVFSGHKMYAPCGIGVLFAKDDWLEKFPPYQSGGDMISSVSFEKVTFAQNSQKFEAGTPNISGAIGLAIAIEYISQIGFKNIHDYEMQLHDYAMAKLKEFSFIKILGEAKDKVSLISFVVNGVHPHDVSSILDSEGVCIRAGHLCAEPLIKRFGETSFCRASFSFYNKFSEIDQMINALKIVAKVFKV